MNKTIVKTAHVAFVAFALSTPALAQQSIVLARADRLTDERIAGDIATIDSMSRSFASDAANRQSRVASARAASLVALAKRAYEANDDGMLTNQLLGEARLAFGRGSISERDVVRSTLPRTRRPDLWAVFDSVARTPAREPRAALLAELENALLRSQFAVLGAPSCDTWEPVAQRIATELRKPLPEPPRAAPPVVEVKPAPAVTPAPAPRRSPEVLRSVPTMVHFALDKSFLSPTSKRVLDQMVSAISTYPDITIVLEGNTDQRASVAYNIALSNRRAQSVRTYLAGKGFDNGRITTKALGKSQLETQGVSITNYAVNRRVLLRYFNAEGKEIPTIEQLDDLQLETKPAAKAASTPAKRKK